MYNWKVGDLAVCVRGGGPIENSHGWIDGDHGFSLKEGMVYRVDFVGNADVNFVNQYGADPVGLFFGGQEFGWHAYRFRPLNDEPDNAELIAKIKDCKPQKVS